MLANHRNPSGVASIRSHCNSSAKKAASVKAAANHKVDLSQTEGPVAHVPSSQTGRVRYTRQNAQASIIAATARMYGLRKSKRAIVIAPETPNRATAQGPIQHKPMKEAIVLKPMALLVVPTTLV